MYQIFTYVMGGKIPGDIFKVYFKGNMRKLLVKKGGAMEVCGTVHEIRVHCVSRERSILPIPRHKHKYVNDVIWTYLRSHKAPPQ